jgi:hypothetical protein
MEKGLLRRLPGGPSFETPAFGGAPQDEVFFAAKSWTLMVRSAACGASRTMKAERAHTFK